MCCSTDSCFCCCCCSCCCDKAVKRCPCPPFAFDSLYHCVFNQLHLIFLSVSLVISLRAPSRASICEECDCHLLADMKHYSSLTETAKLFYSRLFCALPERHTLLCFYIFNFFLQLCIRQIDPQDIKYMKKIYVVMEEIKTCSINLHLLFMKEI